MRPIAGLLCLALCAAARAQTGIPDLPFPLPSDTAPAFELRTQLSPAERALYLRDTTVTRDGYLLVAASDAQVDLIDEVRRLPFLQPGVDAAVAGAVAAIAAAGYPHIGTWKEDAFRTTMVFGDAKRGYLMYTIFNFEMAHAKVSAVGEFARFRIKGSPAVLALSVNPAATKGLWKLAFWRNGAGHEIYLTEKSPAHPERDHNRQRLLKLGEALAN